MSIPLISPDDIAMALRYGHLFDIGQFSAAEKQILARWVKEGQILKVRAYWPYLTWGTRLKTCYINTTS